MSMLAILLLGFSLAIYCFYFDITETAVTDSVEDERMLEHVKLFCYVTFTVNGFLFILSIFGHVSRWLNRRVCFLVLMVFVFASAIVLLVILGLSVGLFSSFVPSLKAPQNPQFLRSANPEQEDEFEQIKQQIRQSRKSDSNNGQSLAYENLKKFIIIYMLNIGFHLLLLIVTGIVSTILYCAKTTTNPNDIPPIPKSNLSRLYPVDQAKRTFTSQSFHYAGFQESSKGHLHERLSPTYELNSTNFDIVHNRAAEHQNRKLPELPDAKFNPVHSTARRNPLSVRSAPNLHRLENVILVNESPIPKTDDSSGESNFNEKSPLIRKSQKLRMTSQNKLYERRKLCSSVTDESDLAKNADFRNLRQMTRSPIRSISEASDFVAKLPKDNPPAIPPRPHERQKSTTSHHEIMNSSFGAKSTGDVDAEVNRLLYEPANKHLCKTRLITVPEPSEPDEDSNGYTRLIDPSKAERVEIQDSVCHV